MLIFLRTYLNNKISNCRQIISFRGGMEALYKELIHQLFNSFIQIKTKSFSLKVLKGRKSELYEIIDNKLDLKLKEKT